MAKGCRKGDTHACGNVDMEGCTSTYFNSLPAHCKTHEQSHCCVQIEGSSNVIVCGLNQARTDYDFCGPCSCPEHSGTVETEGSPNIVVNN